MAVKAGRPVRGADQIAATRAKIAAQALALFRQEGFAAVSMRRLAKEVGCAPMTLYAHFDGKTDILQYLWADVLDDLFAEIATATGAVDGARDRLAVAARIFVAYWLRHPDHFRLVFMSGDVSRADVTTFMQAPETAAHFREMEDLVAAVLPEGNDAKACLDVLVAGMIGIALCHNTIADYPWTAAEAMTDSLVARVVCGHDNLIGCPS